MCISGLVYMLAPCFTVAIKVAISQAEGVQVTQSSP